MPESIFNIFWNCLKTFWTSARNISMGLSELDSTCPYQSFEEKNLPLTIVYFSKPFRTSSKKKLSLFRNNFGGAAKTVFYVHIGTFRRKTLFWKKKLKVFVTFCEIDWKLFGLLPKTFRWGCQNWILRVQSNVLRRRNSIWNRYIFWNMFLYRAKWIQVVPKRFRRDFQNCFQCFMGNIFKKNTFLEKIKSFF